MQGPVPKIPLADIAKRKAVGLVAGGTGITPMLQVVEEALVQKLPLDLTLIYANVSARPGTKHLGSSLSTLVTASSLVAGIGWG